MNQPQLNKTIGIWSATSIVIGGIIGSTIFMKPATMAAQLPSPPLLIGVWLIAGLISMFGAMAFAELGTMFPETGGQYVYLQKAYGDFVAYLYGWAGITVINSAAIAAIAFVCANYAGYFIHMPRLDPAVEHSVSLHIPLIGDILPLENLGMKVFAIVVIMGLTVINYLSVKSGNSIQFISTTLKTVALLLLVFGILFSGHGDTGNFVNASPDFHFSGMTLVTGFMAATTGAFASYDGWNNLNMVAGEIKDPHRNITKSLLMGLSVCIVIYMLITLAYMYVMPIGEMAKSNFVASDAIQRALGPGAALSVAGLIVISTFGAVSVNLLTNARVVFSMSEGGNFFPWGAVVHSKHRTPGNAVIIMGVWSSLLVISGSFDILTDMFIFMSWVFYLLVVVGLLVIRKKMPDAPRPYRVKGYPWIPLIFVAFTCFYLVSTVYYDVSNYLAGRSPVINSVFGLILTVAGIPFFPYFRKKYGRHKVKD